MSNRMASFNMVTHQLKTATKYRHALCAKDQKYYRKSFIVRAIVA